MYNEGFKKNLRSQGVGVVSGDGTNFFAKKVGKGGYDSSVPMLDIGTGNSRKMSSEELDKLYSSGGTVVRLVTPHIRGSKSTRYAVVREKPDTEYWRNFTPDDIAIKYRKGYYTKVHTARYYVFNKEKGSVKGMANSVGEADTIAKQMATANGLPEGSFSYRLDKARDAKDSDLYTGALASSGQMNQKVRGQALETVTDDVTSSKYVMPPVEAMIRNISLLSRSIAMRDHIDTVKQRFHQNYNDMFDVGEAGKAMGRLPKNLDEIKANDLKLAGKEKDARTMFNYIQMLESGYINSMSTNYKAVLNSLASVAGEGSLKSKGVTKKVLQGVEATAATFSDKKSPLQLFDNTAIAMYISLNPMRQLMFGLTQATQAVPFNFGYMTSKEGVKETSLLMRAVSSDGNVDNLSKADQALSKDLYRSWKRSGLYQSIDRQEYFREGLQDLVEQSHREDMGIAGKAWNVSMQAGGSVTATSRSIGQKPGESVNLMASWLAARN
jgi:hypothetical protein